MTRNKNYILTLCGIAITSFHQLFATADPVTYSANGGSLRRPHETKIPINNLHIEQQRENSEQNEHARQQFEDGDETSFTMRLLERLEIIENQILPDLLHKINYLETQNRRIPGIMKKINDLEMQTEQLQLHRQLQQKCFIQLNSDDVCEISEPLVISSALNVTGTFETSNLVVSESMEVTGESTFREDVHITDSLDVSSGTLEITDLVVNGDLEVTGESTFKDNVDIQSDLSVTGSVGLNSIQVANSSTFSGDVDILSGLNVTGSTELNDVQINGNLNVDGVTTFQNDVNALSVLTLTGPVDFNTVNIIGNLDVTGTVKFHNDVIIDNNQTLVSIAGKTDIWNDVLVAGKSSLLSHVSIGAVQKGDHNKNNNKDKNKNKNKNKKRELMAVDKAFIKNEMLFVGGGARISHAMEINDKLQAKDTQINGNLMIKGELSM